MSFSLLAQSNYPFNGLDMNMTNLSRISNAKTRSLSPENYNGAKAGGAKAGVSRGRNGFRKDKGGEKLAESEEDLLEHRTDGTDAFDTLYIGCEKFPYRESYAFPTTGIL